MSEEVVRIEVVERLLRSLRDVDADDLERFGFLVTPDEARAALSLEITASELEGQQTDRLLAIFDVLREDGRTVQRRAGWGEMLAELSGDQVTRIAALYDALLGPAQAAWDRIYGRPENLR